MLSLVSVIYIYIFLFFFFYLILLNLFFADKMFYFSIFQIRNDCLLHNTRILHINL